MASRPGRRAVQATARSRLAGGVALAVVVASLVVGGCTSGATPRSSAAGSPGSGAPATPKATVHAPSHVPGASTPAQVNTPWGRIWEGLPNAFPRVAGAEPTQTGSASPTSATLNVPTSAGTVKDVTSFYRSALAAAGYSVSVDGPLENGGYTVSAMGSAGCAAQVSVAPLGSTITVTVLYGAACPFD